MTYLGKTELLVEKKWSIKEEHFKGEKKANVQELIQTNQSHFYSLCFVCIIVTENFKFNNILAWSWKLKNAFLLTKGVEMLDFPFPFL